MENNKPDYVYDSGISNKPKLIQPQILARVFTWMFVP